MGVLDDKGYRKTVSLICPSKWKPSCTCCCSMGFHRNCFFTQHVVSQYFSPAHISSAHIFRISIDFKLYLCLFRICLFSQALRFSVPDLFCCKACGSVRVNSRAVKDILKYFHEEQSVIESTANIYALDNYKIWWSISVSVCESTMMLINF